MGDIRSYRDLVAWQKAMDFGIEVYKTTKTLPDSERFGLVSQLRRAAVSVASNIAEGYGRGTRSDYLRFLRTARGSLYEIDTQMLLAARLEYLTSNAYETIHERLNECGRLIAGLIRSLESEEQS